MLLLTKNDDTPIASCNNYRELYRHITFIIHEENNKRIENRLGSQDIWRFSFLSSVMIQEVIRILEKKKENKIIYDWPIVEQAYHRGLALIERCEGDFKKPLFILVTPDVDVEHHRKACRVTDPSYLGSVL